MYQIFKNSISASLNAIMFSESVPQIFGTVVLQNCTPDILKYELYAGEVWLNSSQSGKFVYLVM